MYFHEIAEELKTYMAPTESGGIFGVQFVGDTLRDLMTEEEEKMALDESQIYEFESGYISARCNAYAEALSIDEVTVDNIPSLPRKYQTNFYDQRKAYLGAESIQRSISEVYEEGENQFDILKDDAFGGINTTY